MQQAKHQNNKNKKNPPNFRIKDFALRLDPLVFLLFLEEKISSFFAIRKEWKGGKKEKERKNETSTKRPCWCTNLPRKETKTQRTKQNKVTPRQLFQLALKLKVSNLSFTPSTRTVISVRIKVKVTSFV